MKDTNFKVLDNKETFKSALPSIIEVFVEFYGEDARDEIVNKFNNFLFFQNNSLKKLKERSYDIESEVFDELKEEFVRDLHTLFPQFGFSKLRRLVGDSYYNSPIRSIILYKTGKVNEQQLTLQTRTVDETIVVTFLEHLNMSSQLEEMYSSFDNNYSEASRKIRNFKETIDDIKRLELNLRSKHMRKLREKIESVGSSSEINDILIYLGNLPDPFEFSDLDSFSSQFSSLQDDPVIQSSRRRLYNKIRMNNLKFHKTYERFESDMISISSQIDDILTLRDKVKGDFLFDFYRQHPIYKENLRDIREKGLKMEDWGYLSSLINNSTSVLPNLKDTEDGPIFYPVLSMSEGYDDGFLDVTLIHELNHIKEFYLLNVSDTHFTGITGWDYLVQPYSIEDLEKVDSSESGDYKEFSESINELIAQDITSLMHRRGIFVFNSFINSKTKGSSLYENVFFLVQDFYDTYKEEIIQSRNNGHISIIFDRVGKDNFDALSSLVDRYQERFDTRGKEVNKAYQDGADNEDTRFIKELIEQRDEILARMASYNKDDDISLEKGKTI